VQNLGRSVYDPRPRAGNTTPVITVPLTDHFAGYRWNKQHAAPIRAADTKMSAISKTGHKNLCRGANQCDMEMVINNWTRLRSVARREGKAVAVVTTYPKYVQISDGNARGPVGGAP